MKSYFALILKFFLISIINSENIYEVTKFGADIKGINKSTEAVKKAIDEAYSKGGGTVYFPKGEYLCGPIHLKSNITIQLADNAIIKFSKDFDDYLPMVEMRWEGTVLNSFSPLIYAHKQQNIVIKGKGILEGQGSYWLTEYNKLKKEFSETKKRSTKYQQEFVKVNNLTEIASETIDMSRIDIGFLRPPFIQLFDSKNILIEDITVRNSPFWNINPVFCENVEIRGVKIRAPSKMRNTDGIDPDSCKDVLISNVEIDVGDDCIAIKSGRDLQGRRIGRPTENVIITDSKMLRGTAAIVIGSEQSGGVKNITVKDCIFNGTDRGLYIKSIRGRGGIVEHIYHKNISMTNIKYQAILIAMSLWWSPTNVHKVEPFSDKTPIFRDIKFEDIKADVVESQYSVDISGLPESLLTDVELKNIEIVSENGLSENYTTNLKMASYSQRSP